MGARPLNGRCAPTLGDFMVLRAHTLLLTPTTCILVPRFVTMLHAVAGRAPAISAMLQSVSAMTSDFGASDFPPISAADTDSAWSK